MLEFLVIVYLGGCLVWAITQGLDYSNAKRWPYLREEIRGIARKFLLTPVWPVLLAIKTLRFLRDIVKDAI